MAIQQGQRYKHYKGKTYMVLAVGHHSETGEKMVVYQAEYDDPEYGNQAVWVRPYEMFVKSVIVENQTIPRFERLS